MNEGQGWLELFFSEDNKISLTKIREGAYHQKYLDMMLPLIQSAQDGVWPIFLPLSDEKDLWFYGTTRDDRELTELKTVLQAALGSSDTSPDIIHTKTSTSKSEQALLDYSPTGFLKFKMLSKSRHDIAAQERVFASLRNTIHLYEQRPEVKIEVQRPVGRVLRDFSTACLAQDGKSAEILFHELKNSRKIAPRNLLFLHIQALGAGQQWDRILAHEKLQYCLSGRLPEKVRSILLQMLGSTILQEVKDVCFSRKTVEQVLEECLAFKPLFERIPSINNGFAGIEEWKVWAIGASAFNAHDIVQCIPEALAVEESWIEDLLVWSGMDTPEHLSVVQSDDINERPLQITSIEDVVQLIQYTLIAPTDELEEILNRLSQIPSDIVEQVKKIPKLFDLWQNLQADYEASNEGWNHWFKKLATGNVSGSDMCRDAINACQYWDASSFGPDEILGLLESNLDQEITETLRDIIPVLLDWTDEREINCDSNYLLKMLELLALDDTVNLQDIQLAGLLLGRFLSGSHTPVEYREMLAAAEIILEKVSSVKSYSSMLELIDLLLENPCSDDEALGRLWFVVQGFALKAWPRLGQLEKTLTEFLTKEIQGEEAIKIFPEDEGEDCSSTQKESQTLIGKRLAIYTLTEGAGLRAKKILSKMYNGLEISVNHDHAATSQLQNLAKTAEYFVFAANSAKHQAFYAVKKIRTDLIYPLGKGASSIVRAFVNALS